MHSRTPFYGAPWNAHGKLDGAYLRAVGPPPFTTVPPTPDLEHGDTYVRNPRDTTGSHPRRTNYRYQIVHEIFKFFFPTTVQGIIDISSLRDVASSIFHEENPKAEMKCSVAVVTILSVIIVGMMTDRVTSMPPAQCNPGLLDEVPPRIRKVCMALSTIYELGSAMENYIDDKVPVMQQNLPLPDSGVKRQDVDHVFLRFGRRR